MDQGKGISDQAMPDPSKPGQVMAGKAMTGKPLGSQAAAGVGVAPDGIRDLADFYLRWHEFRPLAVLAANQPGLSADQHTILSWLVLLADRIGPGDFETGDETWLLDGDQPCRKDR